MRFLINQKVSVGQNRFFEILNDEEGFRQKSIWLCRFLRLD